MGLIFFSICFASLPKFDRGKAGNRQTSPSPKTHLEIYNRFMNRRLPLFRLGLRDSWILLAGKIRQEFQICENLSVQTIYNLKSSRLGIDTEAAK